MWEIKIIFNSKTFSKGECIKQKLLECVRLICNEESRIEQENNNWIVWKDRNKTLRNAKASKKRKLTQWPVFCYANYTYILGLSAAATYWELASTKFSVVKQWQRFYCIQLFFFFVGLVIHSFPHFNQQKSKVFFVCFQSGSNVIIYAMMLVWLTGFCSFYTPLNSTQQTIYRKPSQVYILKTQKLFAFILISLRL